jgi:hypothetical protein
MKDPSLHGAVTLLVGLLCLGVTPPPSHAGGSGLADAPACMFDFKRDFNLRRATEAVIAARNMFLANGSMPLAGAALREANGHLHDAWKHLEQVMNYGLFAFKPCFTCSPQATIGSPPAGWPEGVTWTFQEIANQVASVEIAIHGDPAAKKYGVIADALNDNWHSWLQGTDYCGFYAKSRDVSKLVDKWEYGRAGGSVISNDFNLTKNAVPRGLRIDGYSNPNERTWWLVDNEVVLVHQDGSISARLRHGDDDYWEGPYYLNPGQPTAHYIKRLGSGPGGGSGGGGGGGGICPAGQCEEAGLLGMSMCRPSAATCPGDVCGAPGCP